MMISKPAKTVVFCLILAFNLFIFRETIQAKRPPDTLKLRVALNAKLKWKKQGNQKIPMSLTIGNKTFPFVQKGGQYGVSLKVRDLMAVSPEFSQTFNLAVAEIGMMRIRELVGGDRAKAQELADSFKSGEKSTSKGASDSGSRFNTSTMNISYEQILNSEAMLFPMKPLPFAEDEEAEDEDNSFLDWLAKFIFVVVVLFAPIVATIWLAAQALTCAMVMAAFFGSIGAVTAAGTFAATLGGIDDILHGKPLVEIYD